MKLIKYPETKSIRSVLARPLERNETVRAQAAEILEFVRTKGDAALLEFNGLFDGVQRTCIAVSAESIERRAATVRPELREAIAVARKNIERFHRAQTREPIDIETFPGIHCSRRSIPIDAVGLYVPGGSAPLFSTALMLGVPARIAGCRRIAIATPPDRAWEGDEDQLIRPELAFVCAQLGIDEVYCVGGAQAIAALAFGTETICPVDKIFGPGNSYVTAAKELVSKFGVGIDLPAGPSELAVLADGGADPEVVAADLLSQAEHGPDSQVILVSNDEGVISKTLAAVQRQLYALPRREIAIEALDCGAAVLARTLEEGLEYLNEYAPEHLILAVADADSLVSWVRNAGSVFLGYETPESLGDYASGTNHTLPTAGAARFSSGISLDSFFREVTFQRATAEALRAIGPAVEAMAEAEGLEGHRRAVSIRTGGRER